MIWELSRYKLSLDMPLVMGILNITPDSFSDGRKFFQPQQAIDRAFQIVKEGADIIDIGAESTRPGAQSVTPDEEWGRLKEVLPELCSNLKIPISLDTRHFEVARRGMECGVSIINDVSCARDSQLLQEVAKSGVGYVLMHSRGEPSHMMKEARYDQVEVEVLEELQSGLDRCFNHKINKEKICIDPGFGFAKTPQDSLRLFHHLSKFNGLDYPLLIGVSRKRMLREIVGDSEEGLKMASVAAALVAVQNGANILRVHDVRDTKIALKALQTVSNGLRPSSI